MEMRTFKGKTKTAIFLPIADGTIEESGLEKDSAKKTSCFDQIVENIIKKK